ncbi:uncharacterized [Tachysurus ichikawai]
MLDTDIRGAIGKSKTARCDISGYVLSSLCPIYAVHYERSTTTSNLLQKSLSDVDPRLMATRSHVSLVNSVTPVSTRSAVLIDVEFGSSLILRCRVPEKSNSWLASSRQPTELSNLLMGVRVITELQEHLPTARSIIECRTESSKKTSSFETCNRTQGRGGGARAV